MLPLRELIRPPAFQGLRLIFGKRGSLRDNHQCVHSCTSGEMSFARACPHASAVDSIRAPARLAQPWAAAVEHAGRQLWVRFFGRVTL